MGEILDVHGLVLGHPEDQWTGLDCERVTVLGWMSIDSALLMDIGLS